MADHMQTADQLRSVRFDPVLQNEFLEIGAYDVASQAQLLDRRLQPVKPARKTRNVGQQDIEAMTIRTASSGMESIPFSFSA